MNLNKNAILKGNEECNGAIIDMCLSEFLEVFAVYEDSLKAADQENIQRKITETMLKKEKPLIRSLLLMPI